MRSYKVSDSFSLHVWNKEKTIQGLQTQSYNWSVKIQTHHLQCVCKIKEDMTHLNRTPVE